MAVTFFWRCEGTTLSGTDDLPGADTSATANNSPAISATAALIGSNGVLIDAAGESYLLDSEAGIINRLTGSVAFWFRPQAWANGAGIWRAEGSSFDQNLGIMMTGTDELRFVVNLEGTQANLDTTAANIAVDTTYFVTASWDQPNNDRRIRVYDASGSLIQEVEDTATAYTAPTDLVGTDTFYVGESAGVGSPAYYIDNIFVGSAYADADAFLTNRSITSYTQYGGGAAPAGKYQRPIGRGIARGIGF